MKTSASIAVLLFSSAAFAQAPFPLSDPVAGCCAYPLGSSFASGDFNEDGREDLAIGGGPSPACALTGPGALFGPFTAVDPTWIPASSVVESAADLTGDGHRDVLCALTPWSGSAPAARVYPGNGAGQFGPPFVLPDPSAPATSYRSFVNPSFQGAPATGTPAIVLCSVHPTQVHVFTLVLQAGAYAVAGSLVTSAPPPLGPGTAFQFSRAGDVNGDGLLDLVGGGWTPGWQWNWILLLGTPAPPYFAQPAIVASLYGLSSAFEVVDVDHDGLDDVIGRRPGALITVGFPSIDLVVFRGDPVAPLTPVIVSATGAAVNPNLVFADFDGDENQDLLTSIDPLPGTAPGWKVGFSRGDGGGHFGPALVLQGHPQASSFHMAAADVDGDGLKDGVGALGSPMFFLFNQARIGPGVPGVTGVPQTTAGLAIPGNPAYHVGVVNAAPSSPAALGVSFGMSASSPVIDLAALILLAPFGAFTTNAVGSASWVLALPPAPALVAQTVYLQWAVIEPGSPYGYSLTPARKVVFW